MTFEIQYDNIDNKEVQAIIKLLEMENIHWVFTTGGDYLKHTRGFKTPVIINRSEYDYIIIGFYDLIKYIQEKGLCLC